MEDEKEKVATTISLFPPPPPAGGGGDGADGVGAVVAAIPKEKEATKVKVIVVVVVAEKNNTPPAAHDNRNRQMKPKPKKKKKKKKEKRVLCLYFSDTKCRYGRGCPDVHCIDEKYTCKTCGQCNAHWCEYCPFRAVVAAAQEGEFAHQITHARQDPGLMRYYCIGFSDAKCWYGSACTRIHWHGLSTYVCKLCGAQDKHYDQYCPTTWTVRMQRRATTTTPTTTHTAR